MSIRKTIAVLVFALSLPSVASAALLQGGGSLLSGSNVEYWGRVVDAETEQPITNVRISVEGIIRKQAQTNSRGEFFLRGLPVGNHMATLEASGYQPNRVMIEMLPSGPLSTATGTTGRFKMKPLPPGSGPVSVISYRELSIPKDAKKALDKGMKELYRNNKPEKSVPLFQEALELFPDYDQAYVQLGMAHFLQQNNDEAKKVLLQGIEVYSDNARAYALLGKIYLQEGDTAQGVEMVQKAVKLNDLLWDAHLDLAKTFLGMQSFEKATLHAERAHGLNEKSGETHLTYYTVLANSGQLAAALDELDEIVELFPKSRPAEQLKKLRPKLAEAAAQQN